MLKVYKVETTHRDISERAIEISQDPSADRFIAGLHECRSEYQRSLAIFEENHRRIYKKVKNVAKATCYIILCIEERWGLGPLETNFGYASLEPLIGKEGEVFWRSWTTVTMQRNFFPKRSDEEDKKIFKKGLARYINEFTYQTSSNVPILVSDQHNFQRCVNIVKEMRLEYELMS